MKKIILMFLLIIFELACARNKGLEWGDNSCYFDSSIQLLSHVDGFNKDLKNYDPENNPPTSVYVKLVDMIRNKWSQEFPFFKSNQELEAGISLRVFHLGFSAEIDKKSGSTGQKDANEFIRYLINAISGSLDSLITSLFDKFKATAMSDFLMDESSASEAAKAQISDKKLLEPLERLWVRTRQNITCTSCNHISTSTPNPDFITQLPINDSKTLIECLEKYFGDERLDGYKCKNCKKDGNTYKSLRMATMPAYLILSFIRNKFDFNTGVSSKLLDAIKFDLEIDLNKKLEMLSEDLKNKLKVVQVTYRLIALVVHGGESLNSGHYWAYGRDENGDWYLYNDALVSFAGNDKKLTSGDLIKKIIDTGLDNNVAGHPNATPYILLYEKEERQTPVKPKEKPEPKPESEIKPKPEVKIDLLAKQLKSLQQSVEKIKDQIEVANLKLKALKNTLIYAN